MGCWYNRLYQVAFMPWTILFQKDGRFGSFGLQESLSTQSLRSCYENLKDNAESNVDSGDLACAVSEEGRAVLGLSMWNFGLK